MLSGKLLEVRKVAASDRTVGRLSHYRRILNIFIAEGRNYVCSHEIAAITRGTSSQVRRDLMSIGCSGSPNRGYETKGLLAGIEAFLYAPEGQNVGLVGVGNLGRAILAYFMGRRPKLQIVASFDSDPQKANRVILSCRCYPLSDLKTVIDRDRIEVVILTVPALAAQEVADQVVEAGVRGIVNFAPVVLHVAPHVYVEDIDLAMALEKVAFFSRQTRPDSGAGRST